MIGTCSNRSMICSTVSGAACAALLGKRERQLLVDERMT
jgi:hypothetical protein